MPLKYVRMDFDENRGKEFPICRLGDVEICCNHYDSFEEAKRSWDERKKRINYDNILVKMQIDTMEESEEFEKIPYRKLGFSLVPSNHEAVIDCSKLQMRQYLHETYRDRFWEFVNWQAFNTKQDLRYCDVLKLLLGEEDYRRVIL